MNERAYDTASLGETSADELTLQQSAGESAEVEVLKDS